MFFHLFLKNNIFYASRSGFYIYTRLCPFRQNLSIGHPQLYPQDLPFCLSVKTMFSCSIALEPIHFLQLYAYVLCIYICIHYIHTHIHTHTLSHTHMHAHTHTSYICHNDIKSLYKLYPSLYPVSSLSPLKWPFMDTPITHNCWWDAVLSTWNAIKSNF